MKCSCCRKSILRNSYSIFRSCCKSQFGNIQIVCPACGNVMLPSMQTAKIIGIVDALAFFLMVFIVSRYLDFTEQSSLSLGIVLGRGICVCILGNICFSFLEALLVSLLKWESIPECSVKNEQKNFKSTYRAFGSKTAVALVIIGVIGLLMLRLL